MGGAVSARGVNGSREVCRVARPGRGATANEFSVVRVFARFAANQRKQAEADLASLADDDLNQLGRFLDPRFKVHPELLEASAILRKRANPGDIFVARVRETAVTSIDAPTVVIALTGMPTYVARIGVHRIFGGVHREVSFKRFVEVSALENAPDRETAMNNLASLGVRWYLATEPGTPSWDRGRKAAAWAGGTYALYDTAGTSKAAR